MAARKASPAYELALRMLEKNKDVSYADVRAAAQKKGLSIFPIVYGRAKKALGLVDTSAAKKKVGKKKVGRPAKAAAPAMVGGVVKRGPGRPRKNPVVSASAGIDSVIEAMRSNEAERERFRDVLVQIRDLISSVV